MLEFFLRIRICFLCAPERSPACLRKGTHSSEKFLFAWLGSGIVRLEFFWLKLEVLGGLLF